ncbi:MAG: hypothetical protein WC901_00750 [Candidatus Margulisiibacteriota bacterium]
MSPVESNGSVHRRSRFWAFPAIPERAQLVMEARKRELAGRLWGDAAEFKASEFDDRACTGLSRAWGTDNRDAVAYFSLVARLDWNLPLIGCHLCPDFTRATVGELGKLLGVVGEDFLSYHMEDVLYDKPHAMLIFLDPSLPEIERNPSLAENAYQLLNFGQWMRGLFNASDIGLYAMVFSPVIMSSIGNELPRERTILDSIGIFRNGVPRGCQWGSNLQWLHFQRKE